MTKVSVARDSTEAKTIGGHVTFGKGSNRDRERRAIFCSSLSHSLARGEVTWRAGGRRTKGAGAQ